VPLQRGFGIEVGERVAKILSGNGVRFVGPATVSAVDDSGVVLSTGEAIEGELVVAATGVTPDITLASAAGLATQDGRIVVDEHMHTSALNVYAAGDVTLAHNVTAGHRVVAEHWRDAAQQGLVAGLTAAGVSASWDKVPEFTCTIGESTLKYRGWGTDYDDAQLVEHRNGFTASYESGGEVVGRLTCATTSPGA
jgi:3-phenylpropionate/trans-cinnamate dioxygenase ferredoxin reductase subunit